MKKTRKNVARKLIKLIKKAASSGRIRTGGGRRGSLKNS